MSAPGVAVGKREGTIELPMDVLLKKVGLARLGAKLSSEMTTIGGTEKG